MLLDTHACTGKGGHNNKGKQRGTVSCSTPWLRVLCLTVVGLCALVLAMALHPASHEHNVFVFWGEGGRGLGRHKWSSCAHQ